MAEMSELTTGQLKFLAAVNEGKNIFLTGKAGTGKSYVTKLAMQALEKMKRKVVACAPTGIAATNIDGQTIHSLFKLPPFGVIDYERVNFIRNASREVLKQAQAFVIDEVSMVRPDVLDGMHFTLKKNGLKGLDSRQVIFVGDLEQLPTILDDNERSVLYQTYDGDTFLHAQIIKKLNLVTIELDEVLRQTNEEFINALNIIRAGGKSEYFKQFLSKEAKGVVLAPHNSTVAKYNQKGLEELKGEEINFTAIIEGDAKPQDFNLEKEVTVKIGAKIMYLVNSKNNPLRNGTLGIFVSHAGCHYIRVGNVDYALDAVIMTKKKYVYDKEADALKMEELGTITQHPIKLAYALSIHKSQGLTFEEMTLDLTLPCFAKGQMYVGLSRVKGPEGLRIIVNR